MAATYLEKPGIGLSGGGSVNDGVDVPFVVMDAATELEADAAVAAGAATTRSGFVRANWTCEELIEGKLWGGSVKYVPSQVVPPTPVEVGDSSFSFDTTGATARVTYGKEVGIFAADGFGSPTVTFGGAIGVKTDKTGADVEGTEIFVPVFNFSVIVRVADENMTADLMQALYRQSGTVNDALVELTVEGIELEFASGELLYKGTVGNKRRGAGYWELQMYFGASPNVTEEDPIEIGPLDDPLITVSEKEGWDYLWVQYADDSDGTFMFKTPMYAVVDRVYKRSDFDNINVWVL